MLYYTLRNGNIVAEYEVHKAFEICTGETYHYDSIAYSKWLYAMLGKSIIKAMTETEVDIEQFLKGNNVVAAVRLYRDIHGCTLREAKDAIDSMRASKAEVSDEKLYVYYNENGNKVIVKNFSTFAELTDWCEKNCTKNGNSYFLNGYTILCGYHIEKEEQGK